MTAGATARPTARRSRPRWTRSTIETKGLAVFPIATRLHRGRDLWGSGSMMRKLIGAAVLALLLGPTPGVSAATLEKIDCKRSTLTLRMEPDADWAECYRARQSGQGERPDGLSADFQVVMA